MTQSKNKNKIATLDARKSLRSKFFISNFCTPKLWFFKMHVKWHIVSEEVSRHKTGNRSECFVPYLYFFFLYNYSTKSCQASTFTQILCVYSNLLGVKRKEKERRKRGFRQGGKEKENELIMLIRIEPKKRGLGMWPMPSSWYKEAVAWCRMCRTISEGLTKSPY